MADVPLLKQVMTSQGDLIYGGASGAPTRLAKGTADQVLTMNAGATAPEWADAAGGTFVGVRAYAGATTTVNDQTWTSIALNSERFDTNGFHDTSTNNSRLTVPTGQDGYYLIGGNGELAGNTTGWRAMRIFLNGATRICDVSVNANANGSAPSARLLVVSLYSLVATDYVELQLWQNSGGSIATQNAANSNCEFWMYKVG